MKRVLAVEMVAQSRRLIAKTNAWLKKTIHWLYPYRPRFLDWRFWSVQGLIVSIVIVHDVIEFGGYLPEFARFDFMVISLFFVPVVYAALNFGFAGSIATALWAIILITPNWVLWDRELELLGEIFQSLVLFTVAFFVGQRVDRETNARRQAEAAGTALEASETRYRGLFESSPIAILVLGDNGIILDANPATGILFGKTPGALQGTAVANLFGTENSRRLLAPYQKDSRPETTSLILSLGDRSEVYLEPMHTQVLDSQGNIVTQVILRDITQEQHRQVELKTFASHVLRAQEEERQRIARELHDETIQSLALLCRRLDSIESTNTTLPSSIIGELQETRKFAEEIVKGLRDFTRALRPPTLDDLGLVTSIRRLLMDSTERTGMKGQLKLVGKERRLPRDAEVGLFRIAQEALWNVEYHSRATEVLVTVTFAEDEARLHVEDNGVGFEVPSVLEETSSSDELGLLGMQERAKLLGGQIEIQSNPRAGTTVDVSIPVLKGNI